jgi:hypothetical protein
MAVIRGTQRQIPDDVLEAAKKAGFKKPDLYSGRVVAQKAKVTGRYGGNPKPPMPGPTSRVSKSSGGGGTRVASVSRATRIRPPAAAKVKAGSTRPILARLMKRLRLRSAT